MKRRMFLSTLKRCHCGGLMSDTGVHAPHWVLRDGKSVMVDCDGNVVQEVK